MRNLCLPTLLFLAILCSCTWCQNSLTAQNLASSIALADTHQVMVDVVFLSSDFLEGRLTATAGEKIAANYISQRMQAIGLQPQPGYKSYQQSFDFELRPNPHASETVAKSGINVAGYLDNGAAQTLVIGAHYDHLGYGGSGSLHAGAPAIHNGADDNASGVAAMLHLAEKLQQADAPKTNNYLFLAFSGEELGLIGSKKWVAAHPDFPMNAMFNMDMVGRLGFKGNTLAVYGTGTSVVWDKALDAAEAKSIITTVRDSSGIGPSDHASFYLDSVPVIALFTGQHEHYHKPSDDPEIIDFGGIVVITDFLLDIIREIDGAGRLQFLATKQKAQREAAAFKVSLGVMPDYVYTGKGMKIDGVSADRPAAKAGLLQGDIIVKMGDLVVEDIYDYMEGLSRFKQGDSAPVTVERKGEEKTFTVTF